MKRIAFIGSLIAVCSIGCWIDPAAARSGGGAVAGAHGGAWAHGPAFFRGRPAFARTFAARHAFRGLGLRRQLSDLPYWPGGGDFDPFYYYPPTDAAVAENAVTPASQPVAPSQVPATRVLVVTPGCRTQEQKVWSEGGGERTIHITRCF